MADYEVDAATGGTGPQGSVVHTAVVNLSDGGTYDTGLSQVNTAATTATSSDTVATINGNSGGTLTVGVQQGGAAATDDVHIIAFGER